MREKTKVKIKEFMVNFGVKMKRTEYTVSELKKAYPFHPLFFPDDAMITFKQQRSIVTKMGNTLYPEIAKMVAKDKFNRVFREHEISSKLDIAKIRAVNKIIGNFDEGETKPKLTKKMRKIRSAESGEKREKRIIADLFVGDFEPGPLFLEIKSPKPNKDQCLRAKEKMLLFRAMKEGKKPQAYFGFAYNPYITREKYDWSITRSIMDMDKEVLIGREMWNKLGGEGTFEEIMALVDEAQEEIKEASTRQTTLDD